jgi:hypothetical protein
MLTLFILLLIFLQDLASRSVYWFLFPLLAAMLFWLHFLQAASLAAIWQPCLINIAFLVLQLLLLTVYFSIKNKKLVNIGNGLLGLGDILFLLSITFYLSTLNFLLFYIMSLTCILLLWLITQLAFRKKNEQIPLAGLQAILFIVFLAGDRYWFHLHITDDTWLLNLIDK